MAAEWDLLQKTVSPLMLFHQDKDDKVKLNVLVQLKSA